MSVHRKRMRQQPNDAYTITAPDPLELISRMFGRTSYRVPVEGRGTTALRTSNDVALAVGLMKDRVARETALTVVRQGGAWDVARLTRIAYREVVRAVRQQRPSPLDLHKPADRWRLRMVVYDAAHELVHPADPKRKPFAVLAKEAKMRKTRYIAVHRCATATLQDALSRASSDFRRVLRGQAQ